MSTQGSYPYLETQVTGIAKFSGVAVSLGEKEGFSDRFTFPVGGAVRLVGGKIEWLLEQEADAGGGSVTAGVTGSCTRGLRGSPR